MDAEGRGGIRAVPAQKEFSVNVEGYGILIQGASNGFIVNYTIPSQNQVKTFVFPDFSAVMTWLQSLPFGRGLGDLK